MKFEINTDESIIGPLRDVMYAVVVSVLREGVDDTKQWKSKHPEDKKYDKEFNAAAKFLIKHYGG